MTIENLKILLAEVKEKFINLLEHL